MEPNLAVPIGGAKRAREDEDDRQSTRRRVLAMRLERGDVQLHPSVFKQICGMLNLYPRVDMFASAHHHMLPRYVTSACDAFRLDWNSMGLMFINPPWRLLGRVVARLRECGGHAIVVFPQYKFAPWYKTLQSMTRRSFILDGSLFLDEAGDLLPPPQWTTVAAEVFVPSTDSRCKFFRELPLEVRGGDCGVSE